MSRGKRRSRNYNSNYRSSSNERKTVLPPVCRLLAMSLFLISDSLLSGLFFIIYLSLFIREQQLNNRNAERPLSMEEQRSKKRTIGGPVEWAINGTVSNGSMWSRGRLTSTKTDARLAKRRLQIGTIRQRRSQT
jgi:hypothetical protein